MSSKLTRITQQPFGTNGPTGDFIAFGTKALNPSAPVFTQNPATIQSYAPFGGGWAQAIIGDYEPTLEDMNGLFLVIFYQLGYILQMGLPEYDSGTTYFQYSRCQYGGVSYYSLTNNNIGNEPDTSPSSWQCSSTNIFGGTVASASSITLPNIGDSFKISGTTTINNITIQQPGIKIELIFNGILTVNTGGNILLTAGVFITAANSTLVLISDGTNWYELSRSPAAVGLGAWTSINANQVYQATTDGFITGSATWAPGPQYSISACTDSVNGTTPRVTQSTNSASGNDAGGGVMCPVRKGDYYQITTNGTYTSGYFISLGV